MEFLKPTEGGIRYGTRGGQGVLLLHSRGSGQWAGRQGTASQEPMDTYGLAFTGTVTGLGAGVAGALAACGLFTCPFGELAANTAAFELGITAVAIPLGTHLANHRRGSFLAGLLASAAIGAAGYAAWDATDSNIVFAVTPLLQVAGAVLAERWTERKPPAPEALPPEPVRP